MTHSTNANSTEVQPFDRKYSLAYKLSTYKTTLRYNSHVQCHRSTWKYGKIVQAIKATISHDIYTTKNIPSICDSHEGDIYQLSFLVNTRNNFNTKDRQDVHAALAAQEPAQKQNTLQHELLFVNKQNAIIASPPTVKNSAGGSQPWCRALEAPGVLPCLPVAPCFASSTLQTER